MAGKIIFRRVAGRLRPIKVYGAITDDSVLKQSAKIRSYLKTKAAAKTSLPMKRQKAVFSVRALLNKLKVAGNDTNAANRLGSGVFMDTFDAGGGWVVKATKRGSDRAEMEVVRRGFMKSVLSKYGVAPETFLVKTNQSNFLVQKRAKETFAAKRWRQQGKPEGTYAEMEAFKKFRENNPKIAKLDRLLHNKRLDKFEGMAEKIVDKSGFRYAMDLGGDYGGLDIHAYNVGVFKGTKFKLIDAGGISGMQTERYKDFFRARFDKFRIDSPRQREIDRIIRRHGARNK
jgi:hypothetical protein